MAVVQVPVTKRDLFWDNDPFFSNAWDEDFDRLRTDIWKKHQAMFSRFKQSSSHSVSRSSIESSSNISSDMSESLRHNLANSAFPRQRWLALRDFFNNPDFTLLDPQLKDQGLPRQRWLALRDFFNDPDFTLLDPQMKDQGLKISTNDDDKKFEISVDTQDFKPEEVKVNVKNNVVTIAAKHEEQKNEGSNNKSYVSKQFAHSRTLPSSCKMENVTSNLTSPGLVLVSAPKTAKAVSFKVPIEVKK